MPLLQDRHVNIIQNLQTLLVEIPGTSLNFHYRGFFFRGDSRSWPLPEGQQNFSCRLNLVACVLKEEELLNKSFLFPECAKMAKFQSLPRKMSANQRSFGYLTCFGLLVDFKKRNWAPLENFAPFIFFDNFLVRGCHWPCSKFILTRILGECRFRLRVVKKKNCESKNAPCSPGLLRPINNGLTC